MRMCPASPQFSPQLALASQYLAPVPLSSPSPTSSTASCSGAVAGSLQYRSLSPASSQSWQAGLLNTPDLYQRSSGGTCSPHQVLKQLCQGFITHRHGGYNCVAGQNEVLQVTLRVVVPAMHYGVQHGCGQGGRTGGGVALPPLLPLVAHEAVSVGVAGGGVESVPGLGPVQQFRAAAAVTSCTAPTVQQLLGGPRPRPLQPLRLRQARPHRPGHSKGRAGGADALVRCRPSPRHTHRLWKCNAVLPGGLGLCQEVGQPLLLGRAGGPAGGRKLPRPEGEDAGGGQSRVGQLCSARYLAWESHRLKVRPGLQPRPGAVRRKSRSMARFSASICWQDRWQPAADCSSSGFTV